MKILVAGASGAIGLPLIDCLLFDGHEVLGITHTEAKAQVIASKGAKALYLDVLNQADVMSTLQTTRPDVVIDMLTSLPKEYTPESLQLAAENDARIRLEGGFHLQTAAEAAGAKRYIVQSCAFWYAPGDGLATETSPFAFDASPGIATGSRLYAEIEKRVLQSSKIEGVALRFGFFYGPGTWFHSDGNMATQIRKQQFPLIAQGQGVWNFVHILDAAKAIAAAVYCNVGAYNIVNNRPARLNEWLPALARHLGAPPPPHISEEEGIRTRGPDAVYYATQLRAACNAKAKHEFNFEPRTFEWLL